LGEAPRLHHQLTRNRTATGASRGPERVSGTARRRRRQHGQVTPQRERFDCRGRMGVYTTPGRSSPT
jgi:hypothetical protein